jgi:hypothetical protein
MFYPIIADDDHGGGSKLVVVEFSITFFLENLSKTFCPNSGIILVFGNSRSNLHLPS